MEWALAERDLLAGQKASAYTRLVLFLSQANRESIYVKEYLPRLAWAMLELGEDSKAQTLLAELMAEARETQMRPALIEALRVLALVWIKQHRWEEAEHTLEETLALCQALLHLYAEAKTLPIFGQLHLQQGAIMLAREHLEAALVILDKLGERLYTSRIEQVLAQLH
jgi:hypothetical protein